MSLKNTVKILLTLAGIEIAILFSSLTSIARTQNLYSPASISAESTEAATKLFQRGKTRLEQQNYRGAIADFNKAIQLNPRNADSYYERGLILEKLGDKEGAIRDFDSAILRDSNHAWAYLHRGGMFINLGLNYRITDSRGVDFRIEDYASNNSRAMLDLRAARNLFAQQNDRKGYQTANNLIQHFAGGLELGEGREF